MVIHAELSCLNCGYEIGDIEGERGASPQDCVFLPFHQGDELIRDSAGRFHCPRCRGYVALSAPAELRRPIRPVAECGIQLTTPAGQHMW